MAIYKLFPTQDTTLYSLFPEQNTGLDEILESSLNVGYTGNPTPQTSRFLIQFSSTDISNVLSTKISSSQWQANLKCFVANVTSLNTNTTLDIFPVSQSWNMGTGKLVDSPSTQNGASWIWKDYAGGEKWITSSSFSGSSTGSYSSSVDIGGGTWYTDFSSSQNFGYWDDKDINTDVTNIVSGWISGSIPNNGFIVKQRDEFIDNENVQPKMKYFSIDTHTIYPPCLEFKWDDSIFDTSSLPAIKEQPFVLTLGNNNSYFYSDSISKFRIYARPKYPERIFSTSSYFTQNYYLPTSSYYAIKDLNTNEYVIDFDETYTKLSLDSISNYFYIYMNGLQPERYYKILIKTIIDGNTIISDDDYYFKIISK